jgi:hypothetical protein
VSKFYLSGVSRYSYRQKSIVITQIPKIETNNSRRDKQQFRFMNSRNRNSEKNDFGNYVVLKNGNTVRFM